MSEGIVTLHDGKSVPVAHSVKVTILCRSGEWSTYMTAGYWADGNNWWLYPEHDEHRDDTIAYRVIEQE
jgi:hypothetical protein